VFLSECTLRRLPQTIPFGFLAACFACVLATALTAHAALGGDIASVQADQVRMQGSVRMSSATGYTVQEIQGSNGIVVREYVSRAGKVFGVAWQGPWPPDLRQLLGSYFEQYEQAIKAQRAARIGRRPLLINQPGLVVGMGGHPRSFLDTLMFLTCCLREFTPRTFNEKFTGALSVGNLSGGRVFARMRRREQ
jgi:Protein of unknown function (DUF2844)